MAARPPRSPGKIIPRVIGLGLRSHGAHCTQDHLCLVVMCPPRGSEPAQMPFHTGLLFEEAHRSLDPTTQAGHPLLPADSHCSSVP